MFRRVKVNEYERALLFREGLFVRLLDPGVHWIRGEAVRVDLRRRDILAETAPVLTRDLVPVGVRLRVSFRVAHPESVVFQATDYETHLVNDASAAVHRTLSQVPVMQLSEQRSRLEFGIQDRLALEAQTYGLRVEEVAMVQVRLPRNLRKKLKRMEGSEPVAQPG